MSERQPEKGHLSRPVLDLCAGIGGWTVALRERGMSDLAVENGKHARAALEANAIDVYHDDMTTILSNPFRVLRLRYELAGLVASTPCQPFSQANGNGQGLADPRGNLTLIFGQIATALRPPFVCLENVSRGTADVFDYLAESLRAEGYTADHRVICAADYGLPQARKRRLLVARRDGQPIAWPKPTHRDTRAKWEAGRLPWVTLAETFPEAAQREQWPSWAWRHPATTIVGSFRPECVAPPTYRKPGDGPRQNQPGVVELNVEQRLKVQGFPDGWQVAGPATAQGLQVGNAIPPTLARIALAAALEVAA